MEFIFSSIFCLIISMYLSTNLQAQHYVNEEWSTVNALPVNLDWSSSLIASSGHLIILGNTFTAGQSTNLLLTKLSPDGSIIWQVEYDNPDHLEDYGIALCEDASGNFLVTGTSFRLASSSLDIVALKYSTSGQLLWSYSFNGTGNGNDVPAGIATDGDDMVIAGTTESGTTLNDIVTIKLKDDGTHAWTMHYDHSSLNDAAAKVQMDASTGNTTVVGGSAAMANLYDMVTLKYSSSGQLIESHSSDYNVGIDQATCFGLDMNGNAIIGGYYLPNGSETNTSLTSLDDTLGLNWNVFQNPGMEDKIMDLAVAPVGDIYVTGHSEESAGYFKCYTAKYNAQGVLQWAHFYQSPEGGAWGKRITLDHENNANVAGITVTDGDTNIVTLRYRANGKLDFAQEYNAGAAEIASTIHADPWGNIYVHGTTSVNGNGYTTVKYSAAKRSNAVAQDNATLVKYAANEIIVRVHPELVDTNAVNNQGKTFGIFSDFVQQKVVDTVNTLFEGAHNFGRMPAFKAFRRFTTANEISITRTGDTISVPPFWATFVLQLPPQLSEPDVAAAFEGKYSVVDFAEVNLIAELHDIPNDPYITNGNQKGLESASVPDFDIEMDRAWDIWPGSPAARLGIFDSGINWSHDDLSIDGSNTFIGSKVSGGWNWENNSHISSSAYNDGSGHGSKVAGVTAALRNNGIGIAGIAGGDMANNNPGCQIFVFDVVIGAQTNTMFSDIAEAVAEGALHDPTGSPSGYNLDVMNMSFGSELFGNSTLQLQETIKFAYDNDCVVAASAGNDGTDDVHYPASFHEPWVIKTGASDTLGFRLTGIPGGSTYGNGLDLLAPGQPGPNFLSFGLHGNPSYSNLYLGFERTSAATANVSGASALLISYVNDHWTPNPLAPDDIEFLMCKYATDDSTLIGYDQENGFGRLNTGLIMEEMEWPYYWVKHVNGTTTSYNSISEWTGTAYFSQPFSGNVPGNYTVERFKIEVTVPHNVGGATLIDGWIRNGKANSNLLPNDFTWVNNWPGLEVVSISPTQAILRGYSYKVTTLNMQFVGWFPINPTISEVVKYGYSMHLYDANATSNKPLAEARNAGCIAYPNPTKDQQRLFLKASEKLNVSILGMHGQIVQRVFEGQLAHDQELTIDLHDLPAGCYFYSINGNRYQQSIPFILN